jgi:aspartyl-tRNA(Asn)/glutamyl-tRNA(Gln) amidotransferase subunit B
LGLPGALPVVNREAIALAIRAGLALRCTIQRRSRFVRKSYFYPDLPKGYQITQREAPLCIGGRLDVAHPHGARTFHIQRVHVEEDAGKSAHDEPWQERRDRGAAISRVDFNRAGVALIEIVSEPAVCSAQEATAYLRALRATLMFAGVTDGDLEAGRFRCDVNVSVRPEGARTLGARCEVKNLNSFRFAQRAIDLERRKQIEAIERGAPLPERTTQYNERLDDTITLRAKDEADSYRYFDEPDLRTLHVSERWIERELAALPERYADKQVRFIERLQLDPSEAATLCEHPKLAALFETLLERTSSAPRTAASLLIHVVKRDLRYDGLDASLPMSVERLAALLSLVDRSKMRLDRARAVYLEMLESPESPEQIAHRLTPSLVDDEAILRACRETLDANANLARAFHEGKRSLFGYFMGAVMKATGGRAAPNKVRAMLEQLLERDRLTGDPP